MTDRTHLVGELAQVVNDLNAHYARADQPATLATVLHQAIAEHTDDTSLRGIIEALRARLRSSRA